MEGGEAKAAPAKKSDLGVRAASAAVMLAVAGGALWAGGLALQLFIGVVALATVGEFVRLVWKATSNNAYRVAGLLAGLAYIGIAATNLIGASVQSLILVIGSVICVDVFAYFAGRTLGGPKIAPQISPSKTWSGLFGGALGASLFLLVFFQLWPSVLCALQNDGETGFDEACTYVVWTISFGEVLLVLLAGLAIAVIAQSGDFLESWLKRKAGVKDSSNLIPGHGGFFDRTDGLIAVSFVFGLVQTALI